MMNELTVVKLTNGKITTNFKEFKAELATQLESYKTMNVTDENLKERKADRLVLTNSKKAIDKKRKEVKAKFIVPLTKFENDVKEAVELITEAELFIKDQTDIFDEEKREEKRELFNSLLEMQLVKLLLPSKYTERFEQPSWLTNVSTSAKKIAEEVNHQVNIIATAYETEQTNIEFVKSQVTQASLMAGLATPLEVNDVIRYIDDYETMDVTKVTSEITNEAIRRKQAEEAAIKRAEELRVKAERESKERIERERIEAGKKAKAEELRKNEAEAKRVADESAQIKLKEELSKAIIEQVEEDDVIDFEIPKVAFYNYTVSILSEIGSSVELIKHLESLGISAIAL